MQKNNDLENEPLIIDKKKAVFLSDTVYTYTDKEIEQKIKPYKAPLSVKKTDTTEKPIYIGESKIPF